MNKRMSYIGIVCLCSIVLFLGACDGKLTSPGANDVPQNLIITKVEEGRIRLHWDYTDTTDDTLSYHIARKVGTDPWDDSYGMTTESYFFDNIPTRDSLVYAYKIRIYNKSTDELLPFSEMNAYLSEYTAPHDLSCQQINANEVKIQWSDRCVGEDYYVLDRRIDEEKWTTNYRILPANQEYIIDVVPLFNTITYRLRARVGIVFSAPVVDTIFTTLLSPINLSASMITENQIQLSWDDENSHINGYYIDRKIGDQPWTTKYDTTHTTHWIDAIDYPCGTFSYRVCAYTDTFVSQPSNEISVSVRLNKVGYLSTAGTAEHVTIYDRHAFIADGYNGLVIADCANPSAPAIIADGLTLPDRTLGVDVQDHIAYVTNHSGGFNLVDIRDMTAPALTGSATTPGIPYAVKVLGDYAFIADGMAGVSSVITAGSPYYVSSVSTAGNAKNLWVDHLHERGYVANGLDGGLVIVDLSDPTNMTILSTLRLSGNASDVCVEYPYAYLANGEAGVAIIDISIPSNPVLVAQCDTKGFVYTLTAQDNFIYVGDKIRGMLAIDAHDAAHAIIIGSVPMDNPINTIKKNNSYVYITDESGLHIIQVAP